MISVHDRHGRARPGHPRLTSKNRKTWMPATSAGMTNSCLSHSHFTTRLTCNHLVAYYPDHG
ncbi:hypothetical protein YH63_010785 [Afipia massiliensis]|uniref:Uncharacterized protein n=1 Tax=Afipia massiliensis TaxID=211460 RepID=A0A4U6BPQ2_9BRAD|nr:hypothetical protein YH63_010785 [Afipia massiliensis]